MVLNLLPDTMVENLPQRGILLLLFLKSSWTFCCCFVNTSLSPKVSSSSLARRAPENLYDLGLCNGRSICTAEGSRWYSWEAGHEGFLCKHFTSTEGFCRTAFYPISEPLSHCRNTATVWALLTAVL